jgi:hypothetical protein
MNRAERRRLGRIISPLRYSYGQIPTDSVPAQLREAARLAFRFAAADLGLPKIGLVWMDIVPSGTPRPFWVGRLVGGITRMTPQGQPVVAMRAGTTDTPPSSPVSITPPTPAEMALYVIHECSHVADWVDAYAAGLRDFTAHEGESEVRAVAYAERHRDVAEAIAAEVVG